jgi:hypothetical protein
MLLVLLINPMATAAAAGSGRLLVLLITPWQLLLTAGSGMFWCC